VTISALLGYLITVLKVGRALWHMDTPYVRISGDLWAQLNFALDAIGMTPAARVRLSGPYSKSPAEPGSWDDIG
jgi:hypothetical protein